MYLRSLRLIWRPGLKEMASTTNFSATKGDLKIKIYIVWNIPCCECDPTASEEMTLRWKVFLHTTCFQEPR